jgi:hypothetical protein
VSNLRDATTLKEELLPRVPPRTQKVLRAVGIPFIAIATSDSRTPRGNLRQKPAVQMAAFFPSAT